MGLNKIKVYTITVSGEFVIKAKSDTEALEQCHSWVKEDVKRLNYATKVQDGYEETVVATPTPEPVPVAAIEPEPIPE